MAKKTTFTAEQIKKIETFLDKLPTANYTLEETIKSLAPKLIEKIDHDGYTYESLSDVLKTGLQVSIAPHALRLYLNKYRKTINSNDNVSAKE